MGSGRAEDISDVKIAQRPNDSQNDRTLLLLSISTTTDRNLVSIYQPRVIAPKIKVLKVQTTAEAAVLVQIYHTPSSKLQGSLAKCTWLMYLRKGCLSYIYTWLVGASHLQSDWTYCQTPRTFSSKLA